MPCPLLDVSNLMRCYKEEQNEEEKLVRHNQVN